MKQKIDRIRFPHNKLLLPILIVLSVWNYVSAEAASSEKNSYVLDIKGYTKQKIVAAETVQGIINRKQAKLFLNTGNDNRWVSYSKHLSKSLRWETVNHAWINHFKKSGFCFTQLNGFEDLIKSASDRLKGVVIYDIEANAGIPLAVTIAGLKDAAAVTRELYNSSDALKKLPIAFDLSRLPDDKYKRYDWAIENILPQCSENAAFSYRKGAGVYSLDIAAAERMFVYNLLHLSEDVLPNDKEKEQCLKEYGTLNHKDRKYVDIILAHLQPLSPVWGWGKPSEATFRNVLTQNDCFVMCAEVPNISFLKKLPPAKKPFKQNHIRPEQVKLEDKYYIAFMVSEGDTIKSMGSMMNVHGGNWLSPWRDKIKINWGISPWLCENYPGLMDYYYSTKTEHDYFFDAPSGYAYLSPHHLRKSLLLDFAEKTRESNKTADTRIADIWYFYPLKPEKFRYKWLSLMDLEGLTQWDDKQYVSFVENCPPIVHSNHYYDYRDMDAEKYAEMLQEEMKQTAPPWFTVVYGGNPRYFYQVSKSLPEDRYKIVSLDEFFIATAKAEANIKDKTVERTTDAN
ncbi:GxGYxYP domain-containing protein [Sedimentisphaera salicampi]|uniref:GxGYxYP putative glycoside hydrolase C-terminal domain-containing protein n=1 Tax=Sedimentisphaera salicampi TaxID=1941349 RepID=A0A1W6LKY6_9BACT|nr:GxGYxYP domain-containing protein [Sedimentisphaera salicampi]ARN56425.1 hypothetical protein STSP1_00807 [Sedimentisphaera salicampi]